MNSLLPRLMLPLAIASMSGVASAQTVAFPLVPIEGRTADVIPLELAEGELHGLSEFEEVVFTDVAVPGGRSITLDLQRIDLERLEVGVRVNGAAWSGSLEDLQLSTWHGVVRGAPGSEVALSFSRFGCHGWIREADRLVHLMSDADPTDGWSRPRTRWVSDARVIELAGTPEVTCGTDRIATPIGRTRSVGHDAQATVLGGAQSLVLGNSTFAASIAIESDYQYFQVFGNVNAALTYVVTLFAWASNRYETQVGTVLTLPYINFYTTPADPWTTPDTGGNCVDMIYEFQAAWMGNVPMGADIGHFLSGANLGCGAGFIGGLCDPTKNFSVCGNGNGQVPFPVSPHNSNLDFYCVCHELGHNFGAIHTHDYCPPIDECPSAAYFGPCQTQQACTYPGTLMSYCHGCGGFSNISTWFHDQVAQDMRAFVELNGCLPEYCPTPASYCNSQTNSNGCLPAIEFNGSTLLSGPDDFHIEAGLIPPGKSGLLFYGVAPTNVPLLGGTLCVQGPQVRTPVLNSGGTNGVLCDGRLDFFWSHAFSAGQGLSAGDTLYAQFWYRDPGSASGTGLTDAVEFTLCP